MIEGVKWEHLSDEEKQNNPKPLNIYIIKPGEVTNRGHGITVVNDVSQISSILR
jgi:hypothetical protein